jgi:trimethylamine:corrinoid methyltransferase-like protein
MPSALVDRGGFGDWEAKGALGADRRAAAELERRLAKLRATPFHPDDVTRALDEIMRSEARRHGLDDLPAVGQ